jgi:hypothetical protein
MMAKVRTEMQRIAAPIAAFALVLGLVAPMAVHAEIISVPPADPPNAAASPPTPTVLRGSPPAPAIPVPVCPPGYTLSPGYGCVAPSSGDYTENSPAYDYWPDYGYGYPFGGFPGFGFGGGRFHHFAGLHGGRGFHGDRGFHDREGFHGQAGFHGHAGFGGSAIGMGHVGGFGRR